MKFNRYFYSVALVLLFLSSTAQNDKKKVLFSVDNQPITVEEFDLVYAKSNAKVRDYQSKLDYLDLYKRFKLKVREAYVRGLDTNAFFKNELVQYRKQLSQPYLTDKETSDRLLTEAYERMQKEVKASHILIKLSENASPKDTFVAYNKIMSLRNRALKGESFDELALNYSEDPSAKDNKGDLGYFSVLRMIYPFENAAYSTNVGDISMPFRTEFGYHILKVHNMREAQGEIHAAHIMVVSKEEDTPEQKADAKRRIDEIYKKLQAKEGTFEDYAKQYSEDPATSKQGGEMPWFGTGKMIASFENAAFGLKNDGDISAIITTPYGFHIIKRIARRPIATFEVARVTLQQKIERDSRSFSKKANLIKRLKTEYKFEEYPAALEDVIAAVDSTFKVGYWNVEKVSKLRNPLFSLNQKVYNQNAFTNYLYRNQPSTYAGDLSLLLRKLYDKYVDETVIAFEDAQLDEKYPDFKDLLREYKEGILLFELTDKEVWSKAVKDTVGLENYYQTIKQNYMWGDRVEARIFYCDNESIAKKARKLAKKKNSDTQDIADKLNLENPLNLRIETDKYSKGENEIVDKVEWKNGISNNMAQNNGVVFVQILKVLPPQPKELNEIKGLITSDYQNYLEELWVKDLAKKYKVVVDQELFDRLYKK